MAAIIGVAFLCWSVGPFITGGVLLAVVAVVLAIMQTISVQRFERLVAAAGR